MAQDRRTFLGRAAAGLAAGALPASAPGAAAPALQLVDGWLLTAADLAASACR